MIAVMRRHLMRVLVGSLLLTSASLAVAQDPEENEESSPSTGDEDDAQESPVETATETATETADEALGGEGADPEYGSRVLDPPRFAEGDINIEIDGVLDEAVWQEAQVTDGFYLFDPVDVGVPQEDTRVRLLYTQSSLYVAFECQTNPDDVYLARTPRDQWPPQGDYVVITLDTFGDAERAYAFYASAAGSQLDERIFWGFDPDPSWDTTYEVEVGFTDDGFIVEFHIPFRDLRFPDRSDQSWGIQFTRDHWADQETSVWSHLDREIYNELSQYGTMQLNDIESASTLQLLPSLTMSWLDEADVETNCEFDAAAGEFSYCGVEMNYGLGARYALGSALSLDAVFNPDFSQVEADPGLLTLNNRFALFLEERRPFFLEGRDIFQTDQPIVYTRAIGQPLGALKLAGSIADRTRIGLLVAFDVDPPDSALDFGFAIPRNDAGDPLDDVWTSVLRLDQGILDNSRIGLFLIDREYTDNTRGFNRVGGPDMRFELGPDWAISASGFGSWSENLEGEELTGLSSEVNVDWRVERWALWIQDAWIDADFRDEAGFIERSGFHSVRLRLDHSFYSEIPFMRYISPGVDSRIFFDTETGDLIEGEFYANTTWLFDDRNYLYIEGSHLFEDLEGERFDMNGFYMQLGSTTFPAFSPTIDFWLGDDILRDPTLWTADAPELGSSMTVDGSIASRPISALSMEVSLLWRSIYRDFLGATLDTQRILRFETTYLFSNYLNLRGIIEYFDSYDELSFDLLLSYVPSPGTVFFLGYRDVESVADGLDYISRGAFLKLSYLWAN